MKELLYNLEFKNGYDYPSWTSFPDDLWKVILNDFFFNYADSFGFINVLENKDLKPNGLDYFTDWDLLDLGLVDFDNNIVARFLLNDNCKNRLLANDFSTHWINDRYFEFDELYFFNQNRLIGTFINHEGIIQFHNLNEQELNSLDKLDTNVRKHIYDRDELKIEIEKNKIKTGANTRYSQ